MRHNLVRQSLDQQHSDFVLTGPQLFEHHILLLGLVVRFRSLFFYLLMMAIRLRNTFPFQRLSPNAITSQAAFAMPPQKIHAPDKVGAIERAANFGMVAPDRAAVFAEINAVAIFIAAQRVNARVKFVAIELLWILVWLQRNQLIALAAFPAGAAINFGDARLR